MRKVIRLARVADHLFEDTPRESNTVARDR
jgi:hypothetical protein